jgi:hypothetical protein
MVGQGGAETGAGQGVGKGGSSGIWVVGREPPDPRYLVIYIYIYKYIYIYIYITLVKIYI